jgi:exoribonuclease R
LYGTALRLLPRARWVASRAGAVVEAAEEEEEEEEKDEDEEGAEDAEGAHSGPRSIGAVPTAEVVGVTRARRDDRVVTVCDEDVADLLGAGADGADADAASGSSKARNRNSVLAIPMDVVAPKLRLMTRRGAALCGKRLLARVDGWRRDASHPDARVLSVLGDRGDIETETRCILAVHDVHDAAFTKAALRDLPAEGDAWTVEKSYFADGNPNPRETRRDFRGTKTCSIDPPRCVDVDDAVSVKILPDARGYEIGVHIADVSHFVREGTHLDHEARARGTTTYLVDRRIDMLPGLLSENLCSLVEREDRLAMSCAWTLDADFNVSDTWFGKSVVRSDHQLSYYQAQAIVDGADAADVPRNDGGGGGEKKDEKKVIRPLDAAAVAKLRVDLDVLRRFAAARRAARTARGAVELSSAELRFEVRSIQWSPYDRVGVVNADP